MTPTDTRRSFLAGALGAIGASVATVVPTWASSTEATTSPKVLKAGVSKVNGSLRVRPGVSLTSKSVVLLTVQHPPNAQPNPLFATATVVPAGGYFLISLYSSSGFAASSVAWAVLKP